MRFFTVLRKCLREIITKICQNQSTVRGPLNPILMSFVLKQNWLQVYICLGWRCQFGRCLSGPNFHNMYLYMTCYISLRRTRVELLIGICSGFRCQSWFMKVPVRPQLSLHVFLQGIALKRTLTMLFIDVFRESQVII